MSPLGSPSDGTDPSSPRPPRPPIRPPASERAPARPPAPAVPPAPAPSQPAAQPLPPSALPEKMKANKAIAGRFCPACQGTILLGDDVWNCRACATPHHAPCHDQAGSCMGDACSAAAETPAAGGEETKACPYCGEAVLRKAKKCKHCREILSPALRAARERQAKGGDLKVGRDALIYGIVGLFICQPILGTVAIVKGLAARKKDIDPGMGTAGMVIGIVDLLIFVLYVFGRVSGR